MAEQIQGVGSSSRDAASGESSCTNLELNVKTLDSGIFHSQVDKNMQVSAFKEKIANDIGVSVSKQRVTFRGKGLKDEHRLSQYHVETGDTLHLLERQTTQPQPSSGSGSGEATSNVGSHASSLPQCCDQGLLTCSVLEFPGSSDHQHRSQNMSFQVRNDRRGGSRIQAPNSRQEWVPRGSANAPAAPGNPPSSFNLNSGGDSNYSAAQPGRVRSGGRSSYSRGGNGLTDHVPVNRVNHGARGHLSQPTSYPRGKEKEKEKDKEKGRSSESVDESKFLKDQNLPQLVQEIQEKLSRGAVECMICYEMVHRSAPIWSCSSCFSIFHLNCIKKWARAPTSVDLSAEKSSGNNWRCPGCQQVQLTSSKEIRYLCFCRKRIDPPSDLYLTPHSCGEPCGKPLERSMLSPGESAEDLCPHVCVLQCHPGPCPPCKQFALPRVCPCGKNTITTRCSDRKPVLTCGLHCDKLLDCGRHRCERSCHVGPCDPCQVVFSASCFCKKKVEVVLCGDMAVQGEVDMDSGVFSCNSPCGKKLSCNNHDCIETCHPRPCGDCVLTPGKVKTCCCGKTKLLGEERKSCSDPIPTCSQVCGKSLICKTHPCKDKCHAGDCSRCLVTVTQKCRCGLTSQMIECYQTVEESFTCNKPCGRKKNCGRHRCNERCCPLSNSSSIVSTIADWDPHFCSMPCRKKLQCGHHTCETLCHSGHCPPCLETIFTDLTCACGRTSIPPPLPCGTPPPSCQLPCSAAQPCGHSSSHGCHFGECPPCSVPVAKECVGGHVVLRNIPCGSKDIRCNKLCGKTRQCGLHACGRTCHPSPCDMNMPEELNRKGSCGQICGAPRRDCRHTCKAPCHPSVPCPDTRCDFSVTITCSCGRLSASVPCDAGGSSGTFTTDNVFEASVVQKLSAPLQPVETVVAGKRVPLGQMKLMCDEECLKLERKRLLADAFDVTTPNLEALHFGESSAVSDYVMDLFRRDPKWVMAVEERCKFLVLGKSRTGSNGALKVHVFCPMIKEKRDVVRLIADRWKLAVHSAGWEPKRFVVVHVTAKSKPPTRVLGIKTVNSPHPPVFDPLVDMDTRLVVSFFDLPRESDISGLVLRFGGECELIWLNDKNALAVFGDPARAATALRRLDHGSAYYGAAVVSVQNGPPSALGANVWGGAAAATTSKGNPWKKAVIQEAGWKEEEDEWGNNTGSSDLQATSLSGKEPPISASDNRWSVLDSETGGRSSLSSVPSSSNQAGSPSVLDASSLGLEPGEVVDDWEKAYE